MVTNCPDERQPDERQPDERQPDERQPDERQPDERQPDASDFSGLLSLRATPADDVSDQSFISDLHLDQIVASIVAPTQEPDRLTALFFRALHDVDAVRFRQEIFADLEEPKLLGAAHRFTGRMAEVRSHIRQLEKMEVRYQREGWQLDAASTYCAAVRSLANDLASAHLSSRGLSSFRDYLRAYVSSTAFVALEADTAARTRDLGAIRYAIRIRGTKVEVSRYDGETDYSAAVLGSFERFRQGAVDDHRARHRARPGMNHVTAKILARVARLFPEELAALDEYCTRHAGFFDPAIGRFERDLHFYLAYVTYIEPLRASRLSFCRPDVIAGPTEIFAKESFDLALATRSVQDRSDVVTNDFALVAPERIIVVTGPNQGGKTTFARAFGQLHHLASLGCPVPGSRARLALFDHLFTQFAGEEDPTGTSGKLEADICRARDVLTRATDRSIIVLNEVFSSTTLHDARFLGTKLVEKVTELGALCVYVTFVDELAGLGEPVVSMMSTVVPEDPARRTFKVVRRQADGLAYALAVAEKHGVTYDRLRERLAP